MSITRSDELLLDLWHRGDLAAGEELFDRYYDLVYRFFAREVTSDLTPLVQETFDERVLWGSQEPGASFRATLLANAYHALQLHLDATHHGGAIRGDESTEQNPLTGSAPVGPESSTGARQDSSMTTALNPFREPRDVQRRRVLRTLSLAERVLIELHDDEWLSLQEIAVVLDMRVTSVRRRLIHSRALLDREMRRDPRGLQDSSAISIRPGEGRDDALVPPSMLLDGPRRANARTRLRRPPRVAAGRERIQIVLEGSIAQLTGDTRQRLLDEAREQTGDRRLSILSIRPGSIIVELEASPEAAAMLEKLFASGDLKSLAGLRIVAVKRLHAELPAPPPGTERAEAALTDFLVSAFAPHELRRFVRDLPNGARLDAALPSAPASLSHLASEVVHAFIRHGLIRAGFFDRLAEERPHRQDEIRQIRRLFKDAADAG